MLILGIDPGSRITGFGIIKKSGNHNTHIENGTLYLEDKPSYADRLVCLYQEIQSLITAFKPEIIAVENIFYHKNPKSIQKLGEVRGVAMLSGAISGLKVFEYAPREVKKAITGYGNASKSQMQYMVMKLLGLSDIPEENAGDALGVALCHSNSCHQLSLRSAVNGSRLNPAQELLKKSSFYR